ncbi:hypothetical protein EG68_05861 [Paragonimus skrjabini miyazakii]|uniref:Methyltransferase-like protein 22 n=1 Tax=Paragonimus skrjabini miyazakii TaxID=59628 RepID=A0A8S9YQR5_9TREM|nr:hypothetical protein EG68_05861 [Paragonimus skrjabini miyazakii]
MFFFIRKYLIIRALNSYLLPLFQDPDNCVLSDIHLASESIPAKFKKRCSCESKAENDLEGQCFLSNLRFRIPLTELNKAIAPVTSVNTCQTEKDERQTDAVTAGKWEYFLPFHHSGPTKLADVGSQLWNGCLLLIDWLIHQSLYGERFTINDAVLELGCGLGCAGLIAALCGAGVVFLTDRWDSSLSEMPAICEANVTRWTVRFILPDMLLRMRRIDWDEVWPPRSASFNNPVASTSSPQQSYSANHHSDNKNNSHDYAWDDDELCIIGCQSNSLEGPADTRFSTSQQLQLRLIMAADVVYDTEKTEALLRTVCSILEENASSHPTSVPRAIFAVERRICFTLDELTSSSRAYDHFVDCLNQLDGYVPLEVDGVAYEYRGRQVATEDIPQYVDYPEGSRGQNLFLWTLELLGCQSATSLHSEVLN